MSDDIIKRLRNAIAAGPTPIDPDLYGDRYFSDDYSRCDLTKEQDAFVRAASPDNIAALLDRLDRAERELERERIRLAACGVVAGANTPESAANARQMHPDSLSGSCDAVACAVDREMALRAENERLVAKIVELVDACELLRVENSKSEREALCWQELDRFISTCDPANAAAWKRLRKRIDEAIGQAIDAARAAEQSDEV